jgi:acetyl esterase/lipase
MESLRTLLLKISGKIDEPIPDTFESYMNIPYKSDSTDYKHQLNIFVPKHTTTATSPVIVFVHGGSWRRGDRNYHMDVYNKMCMRLCVATDCCVVNVSYRLSPKVKHPEHVLDVLSALQFIHEHIIEYNGNPDQVILTGHSAGGHLITMCTLFLSCRELFNFTFDYQFPSDFVKAWIPICAVYNITKLRTMHFIVDKFIVEAAFGKSPDNNYDTASPVWYVHKMKERGDVVLPKMLCFNAESDYGLEEHTVEFLAALGNDERYKTKHYKGSGTNHSSIIGLRQSLGITYTPLIEDITVFVKEILSELNH